MVTYRRSPPGAPPAHAVDAPSSSHACCDERHALPCSKPPPPIVALPLEEGDAGRKPLAGDALVAVALLALLVAGVWKRISRGRGT
nr:hypothetical protein Iba_chr06aCG14460 [Ipomoea batatas]GMD04022.1 hypothetical protein Iba_chr06aCG14470 [Ipomoea batatas]